MRATDLGTRTLVVCAVVLSAASAALVVQGLTHANRPHELRFAPHVALGMRLVRRWRTGPGWGVLLATVVFAPYAVVVPLVWCGAMWLTLAQWFA